jgi:hypothetical protein
MLVVAILTHGALMTHDDVRWWCKMVDNITAKS